MVGVVYFLLGCSENVCAMAHILSFLHTFVACNYHHHFTVGNPDYIWLLAAQFLCSEMGCVYYDYN
jgi:hypothetical protein